jgi:hypothetical protein
VEFGGFARRQRRRRIVIAVLGVALMGVAGWLYTVLLPKEPHLGGGQTRVKVECKSCHFVGVVVIQPGQSFPLVCPKCGSRACEQLWRCRDCGLEFVPKKLGGPVRCENESCRSLSVGTAVESRP